MTGHENKPADTTPFPFPTSASPTPGTPSPFPTSGHKPEQSAEHVKPAKPRDAEAESKKPEELTPEELRLMADTMPGDGPGDD